MLPPRTPLCVASLLLGLLGASTALAGSSGGELPTFVYRERTLQLAVPAAEPRAAELRWRPISEQGALGAERRRKLRLEAGANRVELPVGTEGAHWVQLRHDGGSVELLANRGSWFAVPRTLRIDQTQRELGLESGLGSARDLVAGRGFQAVVAAGDGQGRLEVGRTFARGSGRGLPLRGLSGLVLVAGGSVGPVQVTLTEKRGRLDRYFDYELDLGSEFKRLVLPLDRLRPREPTVSARPRTAYSVSIRALNPTRRGGAIDVDLIGFVREVPAFRWPTRRGEKIVVPGVPEGPFPSAELHLVDESGARRVELLDRSPLTLDMLGQVATWYCYEELEGAKVCDPSDAPVSFHSVPPAPGRRLVVDDFSLPIWVTRFREPVEIFVSDPYLRERPLSLRKKASALLRLDDAPAGAYVGLRVPLPPLDPSFRTLELEFEGVEGAPHIDVGLRTSAGAEPKLRLADYLEGDRARIPLEAFRSLHAASPRRGQLGRPTDVTLALVPHTNLEIRRLAFGWEVAPLLVAGFEGTRGRVTSLGGRVGVSGTGAVQVRSSTVSRGAGQALRADFVRSGGRSSLIVALGMGSLNAESFEHLSFSLFDQSRTPSPQVVLQAGRASARVALSPYLEGQAGARVRVRIPLRDFGAALARRRLSQISLVFESAEPGAGFIELDDVRFE